MAFVQFVVGVSLLLLVCVVLAGVLPTYFGAESFTVYSGSMEPTIHVGALAVVTPQKVSDLRPGDVITYRLPTQPNVVVTHRLIAIEKDEAGRIRYRTKGDANAAEDLIAIDAGAVLGKVRYSVPYTGYLVEFSKEPKGRLLLVVLPGALLVLDLLRARFRAQARVGAAGVPYARATAPSSEIRRTEALIRRGRQALEAGHAELAARAADGVLAVDPHNEDAWLLKVESAPDPSERRVLLQAALAVNPGASRLTTLLDKASTQQVSAGDLPSDGSGRQKDPSDAAA